MKGKGFVEDGTIGPRELSQSEAAAAERVKSSGFTPGTEIGPRQIVPPNRAVTREAIKRGIESEHGPVLQSPVGKITDPIMQGAAGRIFGGNPEAYLAEGQKTPSMLRFESLVPASAPPEVKAAAEFASGLTSPDNALILVATSGVGTIEKGLGKALLGRLISGGFSADMLHGAYLQLREANEAAKSGDTEKARGLLTQGVLGGVMGALALKHFVKGDPHAENLAEGESTVDLKGTRHDMAEALVQGRKLVKQGKAAAPKATEPPSAQAPAAASISAEDYVKGMKPGEAPAPTVKESSQVPSATPEGKEVNPSVTPEEGKQSQREVIQPSQEGAAAKGQPSEAPTPAPAAAEPPTPKPISSRPAAPQMGDTPTTQQQRTPLEMWETRVDIIHKRLAGEHPDWGISRLQQAAAKEAGPKPAQESTSRLPSEPPSKPPAKEVAVGEQFKQKDGGTHTVDKVEGDKVTVTFTPANAAIKPTTRVMPRAVYEKNIASKLERVEAKAATPEPPVISFKSAQASPMSRRWGSVRASTTANRRPWRPSLSNSLRIASGPRRTIA
jgi:hypothetical protein